MAFEQSSGNPVAHKHLRRALRKLRRASNCVVQHSDAMSDHSLRACARLQNVVREVDAILNDARDNIIHALEALDHEQ